MRTPTRRQFLRAVPAAAVAPSLLHFSAWASAPGHKFHVDVCIYGGTSGGVIAAVALARLGRSVALVEPTRHLGGMTTGGIGWVDVKHGGIRAFGGITGEYYRRVREYYAARGVDVFKFGNDGAVAEPHVAEAALGQMLQEQAKQITILLESRLGFVHKEGRRIRTIVLDKAPVDRRGAPAPKALERAYVSISAPVFMDTSYEGDLLAAAGVSYRVGRESREEYGEKYAGVSPDDRSKGSRAVAAIDPYIKPGRSSSGPLPLVSRNRLGVAGSRSPLIQSYVFRMCLVKKDLIPIEPGSDYNPKTYEIVARMLAAYASMGNPIQAKQMHSPGRYRLLKFSVLPNGKTDVNNAGPISTDFVNGGAERYADASWAERADIWRAHDNYQRGFYYFLQTDPRSPAGVRADLALWGLARDEFRDTQGWPPQLYIREARRMIGQYVMRESDCEHPPTKLLDSVGIGTYSLDSHICQRVEDRGMIVTEGQFMDRISGAYPITYKALVPKEGECQNLLVTFCVSATHVCLASIRMEPPFMVLSESAALAAHSALEENTTVQKINLERFAKRLQDAGQITMPVGIPKT